LALQGELLRDSDKEYKGIQVDPYRIQEKRIAVLGLNWGVRIMAAWWPRKSTLSVLVLVGSDSWWTHVADYVIIVSYFYFLL
jgi:hypothetical protein